MSKIIRVLREYAEYCYDCAICSAYGAIAVGSIVAYIDHLYLHIIVQK